MNKKSSKSGQKVELLLKNKNCFGTRMEKHEICTSKLKENKYL